MTALPLVRLKDLVLDVSSWNPLRSDGEEEFEYIDLSAVNQEHKAITDARIIKCSDAPSRARQLVKKGDVLVSTVRPNLNGVALVSGNFDGATASTGFCVLRPNPDQLLAGYLFHWVKTESFIDSMVRQATGASYPAVSDRIVLDSKIPLPPLPEQRLISAILDQADALRAKRREALTQLDRLAQSVFVEMFGNPVSNPMNWPMESLTDVCHCYSGGTPSKSNPEYWQGDLPWFSAKDLKADDLFDSQDHISETVPKTTSLKLLPADTVAIVVRGMILAHTFPVSVLRVPATINQDLKALLPRKPIETQFLACCLRAQKDFILEKVSEAGHGTKRLDTLGLQEIRVPQVPDSLQKVFVARNQAIENLKNQHRTALAELDALFASLQHRAFRGEL